jgi:hypothetical protein
MQINSMTWVKVPAKSYMLISESQKQSHCQLEISVKWIELLHLFLVTHSGQGSTVWKFTNPGIRTNLRHCASSVWISNVASVRCILAIPITKTIRCPSLTIEIWRTTLYKLPTWSLIMVNLTHRVIMAALSCGLNR